MLLAEDDSWLREELPIEELSELLKTMPEIRQYLGSESHRDEVGLRALLERPEALSRAWWRRSTEARREGAEESRARSAKVHAKRLGKRAKHAPKALRAA